jgi:hypothetical protein
MISSTLEVESPPFDSVGSALAFYNTKNPARLKNQSPFDAGSRETTPSAYDPDMIWAHVLYSMEAVLAEHCARDRIAFTLRNIGDRSDHWDVESIARYVRSNAKTLYSALSRINDELETELIRRGLMAPPSEKE